MTQTTILDTCRVRWWSGYVKGRFQAYVDLDPPGLAGESRALRWRPPEPTDEAKAALAELSERLVASGWTPTGSTGGEWFELVFTRPSERPMVEEPPAEGDLDSELMDQLRDEVRAARAEAARERRARLAAEAAAARSPASTSVPAVLAVAPAVAAQRRTRPSVALLTVYAAAVIAAAAAFLIGFHSIYAAVVVALTVGAVCLALDSWRVTRGA